MNILIVEDETLTLKALQYTIECLGHSTVLAKNSEEAITQINLHKIDFIFSDIMMPGISGLSLISVLRVIHLCQMPIIIISSLDSKEIRNSLYKLGANGFINKPFSIADIAYKINRFNNAESN